MSKTSKTICAAYDRHATAYTKRGVMLHNTNVDALRRVNEHGDLSAFIYGANTLAKTGVHRRAILQWMMKYGRCLLVPQTDGSVSFTMKKGADWSQIDVDKADKSPFYTDDEQDGKTDSDTKSFNLLGVVKKALERAAKIDENSTGYDMSKVDTGSEDFVAQLQQVIAVFDPANNTNDKPLFDQLRKSA